MQHSEPNFTAGKIPVQLFHFSVPLFFANVLQAAYHLVDMMVIGHFVGSSGLAAVGNASMLCFIINSIGIGITLGGTVEVARAHGRGDSVAERNAVGTLFAVTAAAALPVTVCGLWFSREIFLRMDIPPEALPSACEYMYILSCGTLCSFGGNAVCALLRGLGDSRRPLLFISVAAAVNVVLDLLLVGVWSLGVPGAAWATVAAQAAAMLTGIGCLWRQGFFHGFDWRSFFSARKTLPGILKPGIPSAMQMIVVNIAFLLVTGMFNRFGMAESAAAAVGLKVSTLAGMPCWAVGQAVTAMAAQNMGAGKIARTARIWRYGIGLGVLFTGIAVLLIQLTARRIIGCFDSSPEVVASGVLYLRIFCSFSGFAYAVMYISDSFATATGAPLLALCNALLEAVILRLLLCGLLGFFCGYGFAGVCWGMALSTLPPALIGLVYYRFGTWRRSGR